MFSGKSNATQATQVTGKSLHKEFDKETALVFLTTIDRYLGGGILISLKHILCIVASIENFIPYNAQIKPIKATVGKKSGELERIRHYDILDIQIENRILTNDYPLHSSLSILTVSPKQNSKLPLHGKKCGCESKINLCDS